MGGKVLDLPEIRIYHQGKEEGIEQGIEQGIQIFIEDKIEDRVPEEKILEKLQRRFKLGEDKAKEYYKQYSQVTS